MANTLRSGRSERKLLWVQLPPSASCCVEKPGIRGIVMHSVASCREMQNDGYTQDKELSLGGAKRKLQA